MTDDLFGTAPPKLPHNHTRTSVAAARRAAPDAETCRFRIMDYLKTCGDSGAIRERIMNATGLVEGTVNARLNELVADKIVEITPEKRLNTRYSPCQVYRLTRQGREMMRRMA